MTATNLARPTGLVAVRQLIRVMCVCPVLISSATAGLSDDRESAIAAFAAAVAASYGVRQQDVVAHHHDAGLPDKPDDALAAGPFLAVEASHPVLGDRLRGFASPDSRVIFGRKTDDLPDLLAFAGLADRPADAEALARRLMWIHETGIGTQLVDFHPEKVAVAPPAVTFLPDGSVEIVWFVSEPGNTGYIGFYRCLFAMNPEGSTRSYTRTLL